MKVRVTQDDIDKGAKGNSCDCPIARACCRVFGKGQVKVDGPSIQIKGERFSAPAAARTFVQNFDAGRRVTPFEFDLQY